MKRQTKTPNFADYAKLSTPELQSKMAETHNEVRKPGIGAARRNFLIISLAIMAMVFSCKQPTDDPTKPEPPQPPVNPELGGSISLTGENKVGGTLTADISKIVNGVGSPTITISGAKDVANGDYVIEFADIGQKIKVVATYGNGEIKFDCGDPVPMPTITVTLSPNGAVYVDETTLSMTASVGNVATGFNPTVNYAWEKDGVAIAGKTDATFGLVGKDYDDKTITGVATLADRPDVKGSADTPKVKYAEPPVKEFPDKVMFTDGTDYKADIVDARTKAGSKTLADLGIVAQLQSAFAAAYNSGSGLTGAQIKSRFRNVFGSTTDGVPNKVVITIESNTDYESYETDNKIAVRFSIDYLLAETTTDAVLQAAISAAITEMNGKPLPVAMLENAVQSVYDKVLLVRDAIAQHVADHRLFSNQA